MTARKQMGWMAPAPGVAAPQWCCHAHEHGATTMEIMTVGIDLAKNVFQVHAINGTGEVLPRRALRRAQVLPFFRKFAPCLSSPVIRGPLATPTDQR